MAGEGKRNRSKGNRAETKAVNLFQDYGFAAQRVPNSGSSGGMFAGDFVVPVLGRELRFECKCRATGFKFLYDSLDGNDGLIVKADRMPMLAVIPLEKLASLLRDAEHYRTESAKAFEPVLAALARPRIRHEGEGE